MSIYSYELLDGRGAVVWTNEDGWEPRGCGFFGEVCKVAERALGPRGFTAYGGDGHTRTEQVSEHVFRMTTTFEASWYEKGADGVWREAPASRTPFTLVATHDYTV